MSFKIDIQELLHIRTRSQSRSQMGESTESSCAGASGSLATVNEAVVTTTAASSTPNPNSITTEHTERNKVITKLA